jgi:hypothetical protein
MDYTSVDRGRVSVGRLLYALYERLLGLEKRTVEERLTFYIPLSDKEKAFIVKFPDISHGGVARSLNNFFKDYNTGTRTRMCIYLFRQTIEYRELLEKYANA